MLRLFTQSNYCPKTILIILKRFFLIVKWNGKTMNGITLKFDLN